MGIPFQIKKVGKAGKTGYLCFRLVVRVAAEVEAHQFPCPLGVDHHGLRHQVAVHEFHVTMKEVEGFGYLEETVLDFNWVEFILLCELVGGGGGGG